MDNTQEQGKCVCGSENIDYQSLEVKDEMIYYPFHCNDCGRNGKESYSLKYIETVMKQHIDIYFKEVNNENGQRAEAYTFLVSKRY